MKIVSVSVLLLLYAVNAFCFCLIKKATTTVFSVSTLNIKVTLSVLLY